MNLCQQNITICLRIQVQIQLPPEKIRLRPILLGFINVIIRTIQRSIERIG